ncbi:MAG: ChbG/HpnK family deacetylase [Terracidiphilus sp.]|nr:ChbG/HpnK family deacetylase [Terracidiphilus sp.]
MNVNASENPDENRNATLPQADEIPVELRLRSVADRGSIIVNADDWGRNVANTDRILELILAGRVSSGSAMVFMEDSERAARLAREYGVDAGLHLNFTQPFTGPGCSDSMRKHQERLARFLTSHRRAPIVYRPDLASSFEYTVRMQMEEYERLYGVQPFRVDGHHHMHLCANVIRQKLLPAGAIVRRNFTFVADRKGLINRLYRTWQDRQLVRRCRMTDYFFDLIPMVPERLEKIFDLASNANIEVETHPYRDDEYEFLSGMEFWKLLNGVKVRRGYNLCSPSRCTAQALQGSSKEGMNQYTAVDTAQPKAGLAQPTALPIPHISVCVCTYKRSAPLLRLLEELSRQETQGLFTYSVSIVDNDPTGSASAVVAEFRATSSMQVSYFQEPMRGIARARNKVVSQAEGDYLAFIDDDEFPARDWLLHALLDCRRFNVDGILGPVLRVFESKPPAWLEKSTLFQRTIHHGGLPIEWRASRTSNVLIKRSIVLGETAPFRVELRAGEDQEFFYRKMREGYNFAWSDRAIVSEVIPPARCRRRYIMRRSLLQGACESSLPDFGFRSILKSAFAVPIYGVMLPLVLLLGGHRFATILEKFSYHLGKLLMAAGINPIREEYVSD